MKEFRLVATIIILTGFFACKENVEYKEKESQNKFTLNAQLEGLEADYLVYSEKDNSMPDGYRRDTLWVENEKFTFTDSLTDYKIYYISVPEASRTYEFKRGERVIKASVKAFLSRLWFIGYPGAEINYQGTVDDFMVNAYPTDNLGINDELGAFHKKIFPLTNKIDSLSVASVTSELSEDEREENYQEMAKLQEEILAIKKDFILKNPKSIAATYVFKDSYYRKYFKGDEAAKMLDNFDASTLAGTPFYEEVKERMEASKRTELGMMAPELETSESYDGKPFKLSSLKGNYVLIDYWGTWCGPCMAEMPKIKELNEKYGDKNFEVLGVDSGDTEQRWRKGIEDKELNWRHIRSTKENDLLLPFNVNSFPTKIILDPDGKIIYSSKIPENKDMYKMLDSIFGG